jgi:uncharacterized membrane protein (UPF0127 family)
MMSIRCNARLWCAFAILAAIVNACTSDRNAATDTSLPNLNFRTANVHLVTRAGATVLRTEIASSDAQKTMGLMERRALADSAGMLFLYDSTEPKTAAFWMYRTRIPLDIAFIDSSGVIATIQTMAPCTAMLAQGCPTYPAGAPFRAALEVNKGYFARHGVTVGDRVALGDTARR